MLARHVSEGGAREVHGARNDHGVAEDKQH